jgi:4-amino-4-deoxy-L-arabinose transferase-like glycosyltransferase
VKTERRVLIVAILLLALVVIALDGYSLGRVPVSVTQDEVLLGLNAHAIATSGRGVTGEFLPLYFPMYGALATNIWAQPILIYLTAVFLKVLPFSEWAIRSPTVLIGAIDAVLMFLIARQMFKHSGWAFIAAGLFVLTPANFIHSRLAMDYIYPLPFLLGWLFAMTLLAERPRLWLAFGGAVLLGLGFYSYIAAIVMMPLYFVIACLLVLKTSARPLKLFVALAVGFLLPLLPAAWRLFHHPAALSSTATRYELSGAAWMHFYFITDRVSLYWYFFNPSYLFLTGGLK